MIKKPDTEELKQLVKMYKESFPVHNVFQKPEDEVINYLETVEGELLVAVEDDKVVGGVLVVIKKPNPDHTLARIKHIAVAKEHQHKGVGSELLKEAEKMIGKGKVEIHMAEAVGEPLEFYTKNGYEVEGELKSHYRPGEKCTVLGKVLG